VRKQELSALTGIRFYAAIFVFLSHVPIVAGGEKLSRGYLLFNAGVVGVSFFFVLSGFILTYNYADIFRENVSAANYKKFIWDRLTKIYPVHLLALCIVLPVAVLSPNLPLDWRAFPFHLFLVQCFWPLSKPTFYNYLNVPSWSISCEWFFYLLAPAAMFLILGNARRRLMLLLSLVCYIGLVGAFLWPSPSDFARLYFVSWFAPSRFVEFVVGIFLGRLFLRNQARIRDSLVGVLQFSGLALILAGAMYRAHAAWPFWGGLLYVPGSALLVWGLAHGDTWFTRHLSHPWLHRLGTASYSLYLIHAPLLRAIKGVCLHFGWEIQNWSEFAAVVLAMFIVVQTAALIVCFTYEIPIQKRLRKLVARAPQEGAASALAAARG
jgi:peptidoglycan/LPS O-acetylase OafA/YrhL